MRSLQARMLLSSSAAAVLATVLAGWAIGAVLERFVVGGLDGRLDAELSLLASVVKEDGGVDRARLNRISGALATDPGWRWRIAAPGETLGSASIRNATPPWRPQEVRAAAASGARSRDGGAGDIADAARPERKQPADTDADPDGQPFPGSGGTLPDRARDRTGPAPPADGPGAPSWHRPRPLDGTTDQGVPVHARTLPVRTRGGTVVLLAEAPRSVVWRPIRDALIPLLSALAALLGLLAVAAVVQLRIGLAPVRRLRDQMEEIRAGDRDHVDEDQPGELLPLATALNALASDNRRMLAAARQAGANLAHALKTPVAVLALDMGNDPARAAQLARIDNTIRHHLHRARIEAMHRPVPTPLFPALDGVLMAIRQLHADRGLEIDATGHQSLRVAMGSQDLDEMLGNLLDNAARHARRRIRVTATLDPGDRRLARIIIEDDGPGIPPDQREQVLQRGLRLDERGEGHGFGLAIVADLLSLHGGRITLGERSGGGLLVEVLVPGRTDG